MRVNLMTAASLPRVLRSSSIRRVRLKINVGGMEEIFNFPQQGRSIARTIGGLGLSSYHSIGEETDESLLIDVDAELILPDMSRHGFGYRSVGSNDTLTIVQISADRYLAEMTHEIAVKGCRAVCEDGTEGQPCVVCTKNGISVRICC